ncbi:MAG: hypothetical protein AAF548_14665 [Actinomycetota bacterium]
MTDEWPSHWRWRVPPGFDRPVVIFDMDGVLSDASHRQAYLREDPPNWEMFNSRAWKDPSIAAGLDALRDAAVDHQVIVVTARPAITIDMTERWLAERDLPVELIVLRPDGDQRHSPAVKRDELARLRHAGATVVRAVEDHPGIVEMYESEGVAVSYVHSGYYDIGEV